MENNDIYKIYGKNYKEMTKLLLERSRLSGRIPDGARIGIKPNLVSPTPAKYGATTHTEIIAGIIEYLREHGFEKIMIAEGSWVGDRTADAYEYCGYRTLSEQYEVPFFDTQKDSSHAVNAAGMEIRVCDVVDRIDFLINVPVVKGHGQTRVTCALKNMKGLIPNSEKRLFHKRGLHQPIAHLSTVLRPDFIVIDHICGDPELEDGGNPLEADCIMTALDPVLTDAYACRILGYETDDVPYIRMAEQLGTGSSDLKKCRVTVLDPDNGSEKIYSGLTLDPKEIRRSPTDFLLDVAQAVEEADSCSACYGNLTPALMRLKEEGMLENLMEALPGRICIGQGFAGKKGMFGIGNCCRNFRQFIPGCPPDEERIYRELKNIIKNQQNR